MKLHTTKKTPKKKVAPKDLTKSLNIRSALNVADKVEFVTFNDPNTRRARIGIRVYKKIYDPRNSYRGRLATLIIPFASNVDTDGAFIHLGNEGYKCRASYALVEKIQSLYKDNYTKKNPTGEYSQYTTGVSSRRSYKTNKRLTYTVGKYVFPDAFSKENGTCKSGVHFFFSRAKAERY